MPSTLEERFEKKFYKNGKWDRNFLPGDYLAFTEVEKQLSDREGYRRGIQVRKDVEYMKGKQEAYKEIGEVLDDLEIGKDAVCMACIQEIKAKITPPKNKD